MIRQLLPQAREVDPAELIAALNSHPTARPFSDEVVEFTIALSRRLSKVGRGMPETEALAFWMRKAEVHRLADSYASLESETTLLLPRGTVFHVPPANVDTLFVYSWLLATLTGNRNVVRLSERATDQANLIIGSIGEVIADFPSVRETASMVTYGHEETVTAALSAGSDVRIIWGGDGTVNAVRRVPLPPHATELTFPDRFSMAAIDAAAYAALDEQARDRLATHFFNDAYWFDQMGCSSPRLVVWVGDRAVAEDLTADFARRVERVIAGKAYSVDTATAVAKMLQSYRSMIDVDVTSYSHDVNELTVLGVSEFPNVRGEFSGGGLFYFQIVDDLTDIAPHIERRDQTLSQFGFSPAKLAELATTLNGRGIDRIVPFGSALNFNRFWDGYDLLQEFSRRVTIDAAAPQLA